MISQSGKRPRIRVLLVDDSPLALEIIGRMLSTEPSIELCGTARDGVQALELIPRLRPHVICTDLHMPGMDGLELIRQVMARHPLPILVLSVSVQKAQTGNIFDMLDAGALDIVAKPRGGLNENSDVIARELIAKIRVAAGVVVFRRHARADATPRKVPCRTGVVATSAPRIICIGASTGGPQAIESILHALPVSFPLPLLCIQHIAEGFMEGLVDWLARKCKISVRIAKDGEAPLAGTAYFAPEGRHIAIDDKGCFRCLASANGQVYRPSVDLALSTLASHCGSGATGVLLTGMGRDGAKGMGEIARSGGITIAQDNASCVVFGMPKAAIDAGAARFILPLDRIAAALIHVANEEFPKLDILQNTSIQQERT